MDEKDSPEFFEMNRKAQQLWFPDPSPAANTKKERSGLKVINGEEGEGGE